MPTISTPSLSMSRKLKSALKDWTDNITPAITKAKSTGGLLAPSEVTALINYIDFLENFIADKLLKVIDTKAMQNENPPV